MFLIVSYHTMSPCERVNLSLCMFSCKTPKTFWIPVLPSRTVLSSAVLSHTVTCVFACEQFLETVNHIAPLLEAHQPDKMFHHRRSRRCSPAPGAAGEPEPASQQFIGGESNLQLLVAVRWLQLPFTCFYR